jgi:inosine-uridine nucleoside N-ribohydrolase
MKKIILGVVVVAFLLYACKSSKSTPTPSGPTVIFDADQCTYTGPASIPAGKFTFDWIVKDKKRDQYGLVAATLKPGKTFEDLEAWPTTDPPSWLNIIGLTEAGPKSQQSVTYQITDGPVYFVCFYTPPDTKFGVIRPITVVGGKTTDIVLPTITPHAAPTRAASPRTVIIDTDMGWDGEAAILYLLKRTDIYVQAVTVSGTGLAHCNPGVQHASGLGALAGQADLPVACGRETPLEGDAAFPPDWRIAVDTFLGTGLILPEGKNPAVGKTAVELLIAAISSSPEKVTLITLGPMTNLADLLQSYPAVKSNIAEIYAVGGAVHVPGDLGGIVASNQTAEWNFYIDPQAARIVFEAGIPLTLVPLDATNQVPVTADFFPLLQASHLTPEAKWVFDMFTEARTHLLAGGEYFWDTLTAAILTEESLATYEQDTLCVIAEAGSQSGQTQIKEGCPSVRVALTVDTGRFQQMLLEALNNP